jgi:HK97 family phage portal protein
MNTLRRLGRLIFRRSPNLFRLFRFGQSRIDYAAEVGDGLSSSLVAAVLLWIARNFPEAPPAVWPKDVPSGQEQPVAGHPLVRLLERPNPFFTGPQLWWATVVDWHANGDAYWLKVRNGLGTVSELWWLPSWQVRAESDDDSVFITHYVYTVDGVELRIEPERVVHFRYGSDPHNPRQGMSPLSAAIREVFTDDEAANFTATLLRNMGVPGVIVSPDIDGEGGGAAITEAEAEAVKDTIRTSFTGDRRGDVAVLTGRTKVEQFGFSPEQLVLNELRQIPEERVTAAVGIPAVVVGFGAGLKRSTFSNMAEAREAAYEAGLIPMQKILAEEIRFQLLTNFESDPHAWIFGFDLSKVRVLQEDLYRLAQRLDLGVRGGWAQVAEARQAAGLEVTDADRIYLRQTSYVMVPAGGNEVIPLAPSSNGNGRIELLPGEVAGEVLRAIEARERLNDPALSRRGGARA